MALIALGFPCFRGRRGQPKLFKKTAHPTGELVASLMVVLGILVVLAVLLPLGVKVGARMMRGGDTSLRPGEIERILRDD